MEILDLPGGTRRPRAQFPLGPDLGGGGRRDKLSVEYRRDCLGAPPPDSLQKVCTRLPRPPRILSGEPLDFLPLILYRGKPVIIRGPIFKF